MGNTHWNLICIKYLRCLNMWAEAKDLWGKTLPHEILLQVPLICAHLHSPSVQLVINRKERRDCLHFSFFFLPLQWLQYLSLQTKNYLTINKYSSKEHKFPYRNAIFDPMVLFKIQSLF